MKTIILKITLRPISPLATKETLLMEPYYWTVCSRLKMPHIALLKAVRMLWLKLDISVRKLKARYMLLALFRVTATNLPLSTTWGLSSSSARMD